MSGGGFRKAEKLQHTSDDAWLAVRFHAATLSLTLALTGLDSSARQLLHPCVSRRNL